MQAFLGELAFHGRKTSAPKNACLVARGARKKERLQTYLGKKRFITPHHPLSPPRSQYQLNWTNGIGDINSLCNWLKYFTIKQQ